MEHQSGVKKADDNGAEKRSRKVDSKDKIIILSK